MECIYCNGQCVKSGKYKEIQRYQCKQCKRYQQDTYTKHRIEEEKYDWVLKLNNEGNDISSIARLLHISKSSVQRLIVKIASTIKIPLYKETNQEYEIDELRTYCGGKSQECWVIYAINKTSGKVIDFIVGRRTKNNIKQVVNSILSLFPKFIYTDRLNIYPPLIPKQIHKVFCYCINKIERHNLTLRTHLKRLSRKTICFSRNCQMIGHILRLYWFGNQYTNKQINK